MLKNSWYWSPSQTQRGENFQVVVAKKEIEISVKKIALVHVKTTLPSTMSFGAVDNIDIADFQAQHLDTRLNLPSFSACDEADWRILSGMVGRRFAICENQQPTYENGSDFRWSSKPMAGNCAGVYCCRSAEVNDDVDES
jgi:hypothetical protein